MAAAAAIAESPPRKGRAKAKAALVDTSAWPYRFEIVDLDDLAVDEAYQRPLTDFWKTVRDNFDPALVGCLVVSERPNGKRFIIDGQTRWAAMKYQPELTGAPCLIYAGLSRAQEAELFAKLQTQRRGMRSYHRFRAQLIAKQPLAVGVAAVVSEAGFVLGVNQETYTMSAIAALEKIYKIAPEHLADVLAIIRDVWGTENKEAVSGQMLVGLSTFVKKQDRLDYELLKDRLRDVTPGLIQNRASQIREGRGTGSGGQATAVAQAIASEYGRKKKK